MKVSKITHKIILKGEISNYSKNDNSIEASNITNLKQKVQKKETKKDFIMPNTDKIEKEKSSKFLTIQVKPNNPVTPQGNKITNMSPMPTMYAQQPQFFQPQPPQTDISEVYDDEYAGNGTINSIKNKEYKNLRALNKLNNVNGYFNNQNYHSNQINPRCYTEPNEDPYNSQGSYEYRNIRPFIPKSQSKPNYYQDNTTYENEFEA